MYLISKPYGHHVFVYPYPQTVNCRTPLQTVWNTTASRHKRKENQTSQSNVGSLFLTACLCWGRKAARATRWKQYEEVGQCSTETGGVDQTFHAFTKVSDTHALHCSQFIRKRKEWKAWIQSHQKSQAKRWISIKGRAWRGTVVLFCLPLWPWSSSWKKTNTERLEWLCCSRSQNLGTSRSIDSA